MVSLSDLHVRAARAAIAAAVIDGLPDAALGEIELRFDQRLAVARAQRALRHAGGCLIAEDVGRGKTYIALALARRWATCLVVAPAALRSAWLRASTRAGVAVLFESHEALSRRPAIFGEIDGIIVDESHHYRTTTTRRYAVLAELVARAPTVLLSATPLQNRSRDLAAQIALFAGERAFLSSMEELSRYVIRGEAELDNMPRIVAPEWMPIEIDDSHVLRSILELAPPARPLDGGDAGALRTINLVRAWASSRAALAATLRARRRMATAIEQALDAGRAPTRREARAWHGEEDVVQLAFATVLVDAPSEPAAAAEIRGMLQDDLESTRALLALLRAGPDPDLARVKALRSLRTRHPQSRIVAFSEFASTIRALFGEMRHDAGVGMLTASDARIASGRISRSEVIDRFAPRAQGVSPPPKHEEVSLLLATDVLSEGVNLQDADVVVHLDLPWNPAKLAQRVGRVRRPGGSSHVRSYLFESPAKAATLLDADARLRRKLAASNATIGESFQLLPSGDSNARTPPTGAASFASDKEGAIMERIARWRRRRPGRSSSRPLVAAVRAREPFWLAALDDGRLICAQSTTISALSTAAALAEGAGTPALPTEIAPALRAADDWIARDDVVSASGVDFAGGALRQSVERWLAATVRELPRHHVAVILPSIVRLRRALQIPFGIGAERSIALVASKLGSGDVDARIRRALHIARQAIGDRAVDDPPARRAHVIALIVGRPG